MLLCCYAKRFYTEYLMLSIVIMIVIILNDEFHYAEYHSAKPHFAERYSAECHFTECYSAECH